MSRPDTGIVPMPPQRVGYQGEPGAFSSVAAGLLCGSKAKLAPLPTFSDVFRSVANGKHDGAVIPIENTLHGSVLENYDLLLAAGLVITGEVYVRIVHNLITAPETRFSDIREVYSHPVALNQCLGLFETHPAMKKVSFYDTAGSVKMLMEDHPPGAAAIASAEAARIYGAKIVRRAIEDNPENYTRFFLLQRPDLKQTKQTASRAPGPYKTSLVFTVANVAGALFRSLGAFALRDISLARIESRPLRGRPWEYMFYLDLGAHIKDPPCANAINHLRELADTLHILGCYPAARLGSAKSKRGAKPKIGAKPKRGKTAGKGNNLKE
jgi:prephenate dehydratase